MIHIFDFMGSYCGMHYYDLAFANVLIQRGEKCQIHSNFKEEGLSDIYFPQFFTCNKLLGILRLFYAYLRFFFFVLLHKNEKIVYLTYGEVYELPFLFAISFSKNGWVDVHEVHAIKYKDDSKISRLFECLYKKRIRNVIYHSQRTYEILNGKRLNMVYVPHFKYIFQRTFDEKKLSDDVKTAFRTDVPKLLFFGSLSYAKGIDVVMNIFKHIDTSFEYELVIAGKNVEAIDFSSIRSEKIKVFDHHINDDELVYLYSNTDYILLPYKNSSQSGIFAMAAYFHKPMILSDIPYFKTMIKEFPSFGVISTIDGFENCIVSTLADCSKEYYRQEDCDKFEMKKAMDDFVRNFANA